MEPTIVSSSTTDNHVVLTGEQFRDVLCQVLGVKELPYDVTIRGISLHEEDEYTHGMEGPAINLGQLGLKITWSN